MTRKRIKAWHWILVAVALVFVVDWAIKRPDSLGITHNPEMRLKMHRHSAAPWLQFSAECALEWHATREDALLAERAAIRTEKPLFNVAHSVVDSALPVAYLAKFRPIP